MRWSRENYDDSGMLVRERFMIRYVLRISLWLGCLLTVGTGGAFGYVIEGSQILQLVAQQIGRADTLRVNQRVTTYLFETHTRMQQATEVVHYDFPKLFRTDLNEEGLQRIFLAGKDQTLTVVNDQIDLTAENDLDLYHYLLLHHRSYELLRFLEDYGIDTDISSLGKFERKVAFVIGAQYPNEDHSQLWIDKENQLPMRWLLVILLPPEQIGGEPTFERLEFRFSLWRQFDKLYYPMRIDVLRNGVLQRENRVDSVEVNVNLDQTLMDIDHQRTLYPQARQEKAWDESYEEESTDDIQKTIDDFKRKFE